MGINDWTNPSNMHPAPNELRCPNCGHGYEGGNELHGIEDRLAKQCDDCFICEEEADYSVVAGVNDDGTAKRVDARTIHTVEHDGEAEHFASVGCATCYRMVGDDAAVKS